MSSISTILQERPSRNNPKLINRKSKKLSQAKTTVIPSWSKIEESSAISKKYIRLHSNPYSSSLKSITQDYFSSYFLPGWAIRRWFTLRTGLSSRSNGTRGKGSKIERKIEKYPERLHTSIGELPWLDLTDRGQIRQIWPNEILGFVHSP